MGCGKSHQSSAQKKLTKESKIRKIETVLFIKVMQYDLNQGTDPMLTIEARFARENTNDIGQ